MRAYEILNEGGNAFVDVGAIHISEIKPTLQWLAKQLNKPEILKQTLGTVGKKEYSGDIDIVVNLDRDEMKELSDTLRDLLGEQSVRGVAGNVVTRVPIQQYDETKRERGPRTGYVQVDFFSGNPEWLQVYYHGPGDESKLKGVHRNLLIAAIAEYVDRKAAKDKDAFGRPVKAVRWRWSPRDGLIKVQVTSKMNQKGNWAKKQDVEYLSDPIQNADLIADKLFKGKADADALNSVESLMDAMSKAFDKKTQEKIFKEFAERITRQGYVEGFEFPPEIAKHLPKTPIKEAAKVGRPLQHLEDLVFVDGSEGAKRALDYLEHMASKAEGTEYTIKWDGMPALYWGRDEDGTFTLTGKNYWHKGDAGKPTSADGVYQMITSAGKGEPWREELGQTLREVWRVAEAGTPQDFRGYLFGDLLFSSPPEGDEIVFTPNKVTYRVPRDQELGEYLSLAHVALAAHKWYESFGDKDGAKIPNLQPFETSKGTYVPTANSRLAVLGPYFAEGTVTISPNKLDMLRRYLAQNGEAIDRFLEGVPGLTNPAGEIYSFVNAQSRAGDLRDFGRKFPAWIEGLGPKKQAQFKQKLAENKQGLRALFFLFENIMRLKNSVIMQLDDQAPQLQTSVGKQRGGEGWVYKDVKLVPRDIWKLGP